MEWILMSKEVERKVDIFKLLGAIDKKDKNFYKNLSEDEKKSVAPTVVMRWLSGVTDKSGLSEYYTVMTNEIVNIGFWDLYKHPHLQYLLMTLVGCGNKQGHQWIAGPKKIKSRKVDELFRMKYPNINDVELDLLWRINTNDSVRQLAEDFGYDEKDVKGFVDEFKSVKI